MAGNNVNMESRSRSGRRLISVNKLQIVHPKKRRTRKVSNQKKPSKFVKIEDKDCLRINKFEENSSIERETTSSHEVETFFEPLLVKTRSLIANISSYVATMEINIFHNWSCIAPEPPDIFGMLEGAEKLSCFLEEKFYAMENNKNMQLEVENVKYTYCRSKIIIYIIKNILARLGDVDNDSNYDKIVICEVNRHLHLIKRFGLKLPMDCSILNIDKNKLSFSDFAVLVDSDLGTFSLKQTEQVKGILKKTAGEVCSANFPVSFLDEESLKCYQTKFSREMNNLEATTSTSSSKKMTIENNSNTSSIPVIPENLNNDLVKKKRAYNKKAKGQSKQSLYISKDESKYIENNILHDTENKLPEGFENKIYEDSDNNLPAYSKNNPSEDSVSNIPGLPEDLDKFPKCSEMTKGFNDTVSARDFENYLPQHNTLEDFENNFLLDSENKPPESEGQPKQSLYISKDEHKYIENNILHETENELPEGFKNNIYEDLENNVPKSSEIYLPQDKSPEDKDSENNLLLHSEKKPSEGEASTSMSSYKRMYIGNIHDGSSNHLMPENSNNNLVKKKRAYNKEAKGNSLGKAEVATSMSSCKKMKTGKNSNGSSIHFMPKNPNNNIEKKKRACYKKRKGKELSVAVNETGSTLEPLDDLIKEEIEYKDQSKKSLHISEAEPDCIEDNILHSTENESPEGSKNLLLDAENKPSEGEDQSKKSLHISEAEPECIEDNILHSTENESPEGSKNLLLDAENKPSEGEASTSMSSYQRMNIENIPDGSSNHFMPENSNNNLVKKKRAYNKKAKAATSMSSSKRMKTGNDSNGSSIHFTPKNPNNNIEKKKRVCCKKRKGKEFSVAVNETGYALVSSDDLIKEEIEYKEKEGKSVNAVFKPSDPFLEETIKEGEKNQSTAVSDISVPFYGDVTKEELEYEGEVTISSYDVFHEENEYSEPICAENPSLNCISSASSESQVVEEKKNKIVINSHHSDEISQPKFSSGFVNEDSSLPTHCLESEQRIHERTSINVSEVPVVDINEETDRTINYDLSNVSEAIRSMNFKNYKKSEITIPATKMLKKKIQMDLKTLNNESKFINIANEFLLKKDKESILQNNELLIVENEINHDGQSFILGSDTNAVDNVKDVNLESEVDCAIETKVLTKSPEEAAKTDKTSHYLGKSFSADTLEQIIKVMNDPLYEGNNLKKTISGILTEGKESHVQDVHKNEKSVMNEHNYVQPYSNPDCKADFLNDILVKSNSTPIQSLPSNICLSDQNANDSNNINLNKLFKVSSNCNSLDSSNENQNAVEELINTEQFLQNSIDINYSQNIMPSFQVSENELQSVSLANITKLKKFKENRVACSKSLDLDFSDLDWV